MELKKGQEVIVTTEPSATAHDNVLPIECADFDSSCREGDTLFVGRYLTNGADVSSAYLDVSCRLPCTLGNERDKIRHDDVLPSCDEEEGCSRGVAGL